MSCQQPGYLIHGRSLQDEDGDGDGAHAGGDLDALDLLLTSVDCVAKVSGPPCTRGLESLTDTSRLDTLREVAYARFA